MTKEELLKPRYKVIADYPGNDDFPKDAIIDQFRPWEPSPNYWEHWVTDCKGTRTWLAHFFDKYPHLFKKLKWWEERDEKDMPKYVKYKWNDGWTVYEVIKYKTVRNGLVAYTETLNMGMAFLNDQDIPATE